MSGSGDSAIALAPPSPRDAEVRDAVLSLVEGYEFEAARRILAARLKEISETKRTHIEDVFLQWRDLDPKDRPDFLTYAHKRRVPELGADVHGGSE